MESIPTALHEITPAWLTNVLQQAGALDTMTVVAVHQRANAAFNSAVAHLELTYADGAARSVSTELVIKLNDAENGAEEVAFYRAVMEHPNDLPMLAPCYAAAYDPATGCSYCLLGDLSASHRSGVAVAADDEPTLNGMIDALAQFHAYWWQHPRLGSDFAAVRWWYRDHDFYGRHIERRSNEWARFETLVGDEFPDDLRALYEQALAGLPSLWDRHLARRVLTCANLTLTNGDCYPNQFLCPQDHATGTTAIVDFQAVSGNFGLYDLVYLIPTWFTAEQRQTQQREVRLLQRYHDGLLAHGVRGYPWETLLADYQLMIALMIFDAVWDATNGSPQSYWWPKLQCLTSAFRDWQCDALFEERS